MTYEWVLNTLAKRSLAVDLVTIRHHKSPKALMGGIKLSDVLKSLADKGKLANRTCVVVSCCRGGPGVYQSPKTGGNLVVNIPGWCNAGC